MTDKVKLTLKEKIALTGFAGMVVSSLVLSGVYFYQLAQKAERMEEGGAVIDQNGAPTNQVSNDQPIDQQGQTPITQGVEAITEAVPTSETSSSRPINRETATSSYEPPLWRKNAIEPPPLDGKIPLAIVIDDMGHDMEMTDQMATLPRPMTFSFLPYINKLQDQARTVSVMGHELMLHLPMEPTGSNNPGPNALVRDLPYNETLKRLRWNLDQFEGYVGINNHMGSQYTASRSFMFPVLQEVHKRQLLFLDSRTSAESVAMNLSAELNIPTLERDVFLDNVRDLKLIERQLETLEKTAISKGYGIAIGHPYPETYQALRAWLPTLADKGFKLWPISAFIDYQAQKKAGQ